MTTAVSAAGAFVIGALLVFVVMRRWNGYRIEYRSLRIISTKENHMSTTEQPPQRPDENVPPGHDPDGPGESENAPGHNKPEPEPRPGVEREREVERERDVTQVIPDDDRPR